MPAAVSCVIDAMVVFVLPCCVKNFLIVRQNLNAENPRHGIVCYHHLNFVPTRYVAFTHSRKGFKF